MREDKESARQRMEDLLDTYARAMRSGDPLSPQDFNMSSLIDEIEQEARDEERSTLICSNCDNSEGIVSTEDA